MQRPLKDNCFFYCQSRFLGFLEIKREGKKQFNYTYSFMERCNRKKANFKKLKDTAKCKQYSTAFS